MKKVVILAVICAVLVVARQAKSVKPKTPLYQQDVDQAQLTGLRKRYQDLVSEQINSMSQDELKVAIKRLEQTGRERQANDLLQQATGLLERILKKFDGTGAAKNAKAMLRSMELKSSPLYPTTLPSGSY